MDPQPSKLGYPFRSKMKIFKLFSGINVKLLGHSRVKEYRFRHTVILYQGAKVNKTVLCCAITIYVVLLLAMLRPVAQYAEKL